MTTAGRTLKAEAWNWGLCRPLCTDSSAFFRGWDRSPSLPTNTCHLCLLIGTLSGLLPESVLPEELFFVTSETRSLPLTLKGPLFGG